MGFCHHYKTLNCPVYLTDDLIGNTKVIFGSFVFSDEMIQFWAMDQKPKLLKITRNTFLDDFLVILSSFNFFNKIASLGRKTKQSLDFR